MGIVSQRLLGDLRSDFGHKEPSAMAKDDDHSDVQYLDTLDFLRWQAEYITTKKKSKTR